MRVFVYVGKFKVKTWPKVDDLKLVSACFLSMSTLSGYIEVLKLKMQVKAALLGEWLQSQAFESTWKNKLKDAFQSFESVRQFYDAYPSPDDADAAQADTAWLVGCPESVSIASEFLYEVLYADAFDGRYRDAVKSKHEAGDFLAYATVKKRLSDVEDALRSEAKPAGAPAGVVSTATGAATSLVSAAEGSANTAKAASASEGGGSDAQHDRLYNSLSADEQEMWRQHMLKTIRTHCRFVVDNSSAADLEKNLRDCPYAMLRGDPTGLVLIHFDVKKYGEPLTRPDLRIATLRDSLYTKVVKAVLNSRRASSEAPPNLAVGEVAVLLDGGKKSNKNKLVQPFRDGTTKDKSKKDKAEDEEDEDGNEEEALEDDERPSLVCDTLQVAYTEESLATRKKRLRGTASLKQIEWAHILSCGRLSLPSRQRKFYSGSSSGDLIQGVVKPTLSDEWHLSWKEKKSLYGKRHLIAVGGKTEEAGDDGPARIGDRTANAMEPVCFHSMPAEFYAELIHTFFCKLVIDLTPTDAKFGYECLKARVGYVAVAFNNEHVALLERRLLELLKKDMTESDSPLFSSAYCEAVGLNTSAVKRKAAAAVDAVAKPKGKGRGRGRGRTKTAAKPAAGDAETQDDKATAAAKKKPKTGGPEAEGGELVEVEDDEPEEGEAEDDDVWDPLAS